MGSKSPPVLSVGFYLVPAGFTQTSWVNTARPYVTTTNNQSCIGWKHPTTTSGVGCFGVHYNTTFKNVVVGLVLVGTKNYNFVK